MMAKNYEYKKATIADIDELVRTRIIVLRAANKLSNDMDGILEAVNGLIDYCELEMVHIGNDGKETGIITLILQ